MHFTIKLAGLRIEINSIHDEIYKMCEGYLAEGEPADFTVTTSETDIAFECEKSIREAILSRDAGRLPEDRRGNAEA